MRTFLFFVSFCVIACFADEFHEDTNPLAGEDECLSETYPHIQMKRGRLVDIPFQCTRMFCHSDGSITIETCVPGNTKDGCYLTNPYLSLPYPHCCNFRQTCS